MVHASARFLGSQSLGFYLHAILGIRGLHILGIERSSHNLSPNQLPSSLQHIIIIRKGSYPPNYKDQWWGFLVMGNMLPPIGAYMTGKINLVHKPTITAHYSGSSLVVPSAEKTRRFYGQTRHNKRVNSLFSVLHRSFLAKNLCKLQGITCLVPFPCWRRKKKKSLSLQKVSANQYRSFSLLNK